MANRAGATRRLLVPILFVLAGAILAQGRPALAQQGTGTFTGTVYDNSSKKPLPDVVVTVTSPALQEAQISVTDKTGFYRVPGLPPGVYQINIDHDGFFPNQQGNISVRADITLRMNASMAPSTGAAEEVVLTVRPTVDVGSSTTGTSLNSDLLKRVPVSAPGGKGSGSRSFESVAEVAPGAAADSYGTSINGASSPENHYSLDGLSVGNPAKGTVGTQLSSEFVEEVNVVTAGYMPEFGRSTGGVLNVITKSGSNDFHGQIFGYMSPGGLEGSRKVVQQAATPVEYAPSLSYIGDVGFDLGGPIAKDKLWFYVGGDISNTKYNLLRTIHRTIEGQNGAEDTIEAAPIDSANYIADSHTLQGMAKLTWAINADNRLTLAVYGTPTSSGGGAKFDGQNVTPGHYAIDPQQSGPEVGADGTYSSQAHQYISNPYDASIKWNSSFLQKKLLLDVMFGIHHQYDSARASDGSTANSTTGLSAFYNVNWQRTPDAMTMRTYHSIGEFEPLSASAQAACMETGYNCYVANYQTGSPLSLNEAIYNRYHGSIITTYLANFLGHHLFKAGVDGELTSYQNTKVDRVFIESTDGTQFNDQERFGVLLGPDTVDGNVHYIDPLRKKTQSLTIGGFVQDSWSILDKVTVNLGARYDAQYFYNTDGVVALSLPNQWSPRLGLIFDPTQSGKAKLFFNYARYYENSPLDFADVALVGEPQLKGGHNCDPTSFSDQLSTRPAMPTAANPNDKGGCQNSGNFTANSNEPPGLPNKSFTIGGNGSSIDPSIQASSSDEYSAGGEYEVMPDARVGVSFTYRKINRWIEDMALVALQPEFDGNPGYGIGQGLPKISRNYQAMTAYFMKTFSHSWLAQVSYTLASLRGNYSGLVASEDNYLGPNATADYDSPNVERNRYGALPGDIRHTFKVLASKDWEFNPMNHFTTGVSLRARSGGATSYLATDPYTYPGESYLTARGSGPRLPWNYGADVQLAYRVALTKQFTLSVTADIFNALNFQGVTKTDNIYTQDSVIATEGTKVADLSKVTNTDGKAITVSPSFGQPTQYQDPRVFRFGLRGEF